MQVWSAAIVCVTALAALPGCRATETGQPQSGSAVLRVGVAGLSPTNPGAGLRQLGQILSVEGLARVREDGRAEPSLAEAWNFAPDGRTLSVRLKSGIKFQDGSPLTPDTVAKVLKSSMAEWFGPIADDVEQVSAAGSNAVDIRIRRRSTFLIEALEAPISKPGSSIGTGPFAAVPGSTSELRANADYYGGRPVISEIHVENFPAVRTAWAKLLRDELDMLYEVNADALSSLEHSANVAVFTFTRRYQYALALNKKSEALRPVEVRRALNIALDRAKVVSVALNGHGVPSSSPLWPRYWAVDQRMIEGHQIDPAAAAKLLNGGRAASPKRAALRFRLLIVPDAVYERIALEVKRQLEAVGVEMEVQAAPPDQLGDAIQRGTYDAVLTDAVSGPTLIRPYGLWHSNMPGNPGTYGNRAVDEAFDAVRSAETDPAYRMAVANLDRAFADDPPAIFLAWSVRARAVSKRFDVQGEEGRDVLSTLRFWKPTSGRQQASRN
ncbi:MAG TPA: ABC transporter substrate-binding protein [Vicinamibacterales bacterium]|nr:ABC transporter substrate-binding protein [Vicinamibacterales bacterium]